MHTAEDSTASAATTDTNKDRIRLQVSVKGALSLYGIRRFPVTFYADEWETILEKSGTFRWMDYQVQYLQAGPVRLRARHPL